jgi:hypothetical protein
MNEEHFRDLTEWSSSLHNSYPSTIIDIPEDAGVSQIEKRDCAVQTECIEHSSNNSCDDDNDDLREGGEDSVYAVLMTSGDTLPSETLSSEIMDMDSIGQLIIPAENEDMEGIITERSNSTCVESKDGISINNSTDRGLGFLCPLMVPIETEDLEGIDAEGSNSACVESKDDYINGVANSVSLLHDDIVIKLHRICCCFCMYSMPLEEFSPSDLVYMQFIDFRGRYCVVQDIHEDRNIFQLGCHDETWEVGYEELISLIPPLSGADEIFFSPNSNNNESLEVVGRAAEILLKQKCDLDRMKRKFDLVQNLEGAIAYVFREDEDVNNQANSNPKCEFCSSVPCCKWDFHCKMVALEVETWRRCGNIPRTDQDCRMEFYKRLQDGGIIVNTCIVNYARKYFPRPPSFEESFEDYQDDMNIGPFLEFERNRQFKRQVQVISLNAVSFCTGAIARGLWW